MTTVADNREAGASNLGPRAGRLFRKYAAMFVAIVSFALVINGLSDILFSYREQRTLLIRIQHDQAESAAEKIVQFFKEIEGQLAWATQVPWSAGTSEEWRFDAIRVMRLLPAVYEITQLDEQGREQLRISREAPDVIGSEMDYSHHPAFLEAMKNKVHYGPVDFVRESEPYMTIALAGIQRDGVILARVNLKFIWDVVSRIRVGKHGHAYVIDARGRLIAAPDISLVLRNTDLSHLAHVAATRATGSKQVNDLLQVVDFRGRQALSAFARVAPLDWVVFVELPIDEALAPLYDSITRSGFLLLASLTLAILAGLFLAHKMVVPIRTLSSGALRIGYGDLTQRISIHTGDELEALGDQFNDMAARLQESYATLERKVEERTSELEIANRAKSRFLAAASHDLRQPLHALGLFVAQLKERMSAPERRRLVARIDAALAAMNDLFSALLDISKLDAGVLTPNIEEFPVARLFKGVDTTFADAAKEKGLSLRVIDSTIWVRSDFILLERIVFNFVSNALRYTNRGGVVVGCRQRGAHLRIEVWDTGIGVPPDQHKEIFSEFYRLGEQGRERRAGLGLGLAIVDRLCRLLDHPIHLASTIGKGSCFSVEVPRVAASEAILKPPAPVCAPFGMPTGNLVAVIDDDSLVLEGMVGVLRSWGYRVIACADDSAALVKLTKYGTPPELIISDYRLADGRTGIEAIELLRSELCADIPAFLVSGNLDPKLLQEIRATGYHMLYKPVDPMTLRALVSQLLRKQVVRPGLNEIEHAQA